jgi:hypothetical protein
LFKSTDSYSISCDDAFEKARRIGFNGEELWRAACDEELTKWKVYKEAVGCFEQAEAILNAADHKAFSGDSQEIVNLAMLIARRKIHAKADYARCKATLGFHPKQRLVFKQLKHLRKAAAGYLEIFEIERAATCYRQAGLVGHERNDFLQSGLCWLIINNTSSVDMSLTTFLEGNLFFEAAAFIEDSQCFAHATDTDHLQSRYLETFSECHLIISEIIRLDLEMFTGSYEVLGCMLSLANRPGETFGLVSRDPASRKHWK